MIETGCVFLFINDSMRAGLAFLELGDNVLDISCSSANMAVSLLLR